MLRTESAADTFDLGRRIGAAIEPGDVVTLAGPFGAGKTTFVQGLARGLGIVEWVSSPSFALVNEYLPHEGGARIPFFHLDLYRLRDATEADELAIDEYLARGGALAVEWPSVAKPLLPRDRLELDFELDGDARRIHFVSHGPRSERLARALAGGATC